MIRFDGLDQTIENIGHGMGHTTPVGNHGHAERIIEKPIGGHFHAFQEDFDGRPFLMAIEREAVDGGIVFVAADRFLSGLQIRRPQSLECPVGQDDAFACEISKERFRDIDAHFEETGIGIVIREFLMFVVIGIRNIGLTNAAQGTVPIDFREDTDFEPPVTWNSVGPGQVSHHGEFASQRVAKAVEKRQERVGSHELLEASDHGGDE